MLSHSAEPHLQNFRFNSSVMLRLLTSFRSYACWRLDRSVCFQRGVVSYQAGSQDPVHQQPGARNPNLGFIFLLPFLANEVPRSSQASQFMNQN